MTQKQFDLLPGLLTRKLFQQITGLSDEDLRDLVKAGQLTVQRSREGGYAKYPKAEAARLAGFTL